jgi:TetR/AcrR family transcriptional regulator, copper-responsive repressor
MREAGNTEANRDPEVRPIVEQTMTSFTATFVERCKRAERDGELSRTRPTRSHKSPRQR